MCEDYGLKAKWNDCVDCGMERLSHLCCAVLRWVNTVDSLQLIVHSEENIPNRRMVMRFTYRKHMIIKPELFFLTATIEREEGNLLVFRAAERGKSVGYLCGYYT